MNVAKKESLGQSVTRPQSEGPIAAFLQNAPFGAHVYELLADNKLIFTGANAAADLMLGLDHRQFVGRTIEEIFPPLARTEIPAAYRRVAAKGVSYSKDQFEYEQDAIKGAFEVRAFQTAPRCVTVFFLDITERRRTEEALRKSEARIKSIFRAAPTGIGVVVNRIIKEANARLCEMTGYNRDELLEQSARLLYPTDEEYEFVGREKYSQMREHGTGTVETRWRRKDGSIRDILLCSTPLDLTDLSVGVTFTALDITERKIAEKTRIEMERRVLHAQKLESLGVLAGGIAHDFNNLLFVMLGDLDFALKNMAAPSAAHRHIERAAQAAKRAAELTRQMLAYSGKGCFLFQKMSLNQLIEENAHIYHASTAKSATLKFELHPGLPLTIAEPAQVQQIVMNLISNASEALDKESGIVSVRTGIQQCDADYLAQTRTEVAAAPGRFVYVEVSDTGSGMDAEAQRRLFEPFFTTKSTGRGLGLSAVMGIVQGHKGAIKVDSVVGRGTTIRVLFPALAGDSSELTRAAALKESPAGTSPEDAAPGPKTILIVEDEELVRNVCRDMTEYMGHRVITASDGIQAVESFRQHANEIDLVILDLSMPRMSGLAVFNELKKLRSNIRVILSSGYSEQDATRSFMGQGLAGFIQKPYRLEELRSVIGKSIGAGREG